MSNTPAKTKLEIIRETVEAYAPDPDRLRSVKRSDKVDKNDVCVYTPPDGSFSPGCAVGRVLTSEGHATISQELKITVQGFETVDEVLQPEYHGHSVDFWAGLQRIHDDFDNWTSEGLTPLGENLVINQLAMWTDLSEQDAQALSEDENSWLWSALSKNI